MFLITLAGSPTLRIHSEMVLDHIFRLNHTPCLFPTNGVFTLLLSAGTQRTRGHKQLCECHRSTSTACHLVSRSISPSWVPGTMCCFRKVTVQTWDLLHSGRHRTNIGTRGLGPPWLGERPSHFFLGCVSPCGRGCETSDHTFGVSLDPFGAWSLPGL